MWIQLAYKLVGKYDQKFVFENGDEIYNILQKYIPTKPDNDVVQKFGTTMFSNAVCGTFC